MILLIPPTLLILSAIILAFLQRWRRQYWIVWLFSTVFSIISWILYLFFRLQIPIQYTFETTSSFLLFPNWLVYQIDPISWAFSLAYLAALFAIVIISVVNSIYIHEQETLNQQIIFSMFICGIGLLYIAAGSLSTVLLTLAGLNVVITLYRLYNSISAELTNSIIVSFGFQLFGLGLIIATTLITNIDPAESGIPQLGAFTSLLITLAAFSQIISVTFTPSMFKITTRSSIGEYFISLTIVISGLYLLTRLTELNLGSNLAGVIYAIASLLALFSSVFWFYSKDAIEGQNSWLIGVSALVLASAAYTQTQAALAWSLVIILPGSVLFNFSFYERKLSLLILISVLGITALPLTPAWQGVNTLKWSQPNAINIFASIVLILSLGFLISGFFRHGIQKTYALNAPERWVWLIYPAGFGMLVITSFIILIFGLPGLSNNLQAFPSLLQSWPAYVVTGLAAAFYLGSSRISTTGRLIQRTKELGTDIWQLIPSLKIYSLIQDLLLFVIKIFEGSGGLLWSVLFSILLITLVLQILRN